MDTSIEVSIRWNNYWVTADHEEIKIVF